MVMEELRTMKAENDRLNKALILVAEGRPKELWNVIGDHPLT